MHTTKFKCNIVIDVHNQFNTSSCILFWRKTIRSSNCDDLLDTCEYKLKQFNALCWHHDICSMFSSRWGNTAKFQQCAITTRTPIGDALVVSPGTQSAMCCGIKVRFLRFYESLGILDFAMLLNTKLCNPKSCMTLLLWKDRINTYFYRGFWSIHHTQQST